MNALKSFRFLDKVTSTTTSEVLRFSNLASILVLEISGTATSIQLKLQGIVDMENDTGWSDIGYVDSTMEVMGTEITSNGIYIYGIDGYCKIRVVGVNISGGELTAFGKVGE